VAADDRQPRRRRSQTLTPALVDPADLPEDAAGRIALIVVRAPDDVTDPKPDTALPPPPPPAPPPDATRAAGKTISAGVTAQPAEDLDLPPMRPGLGYWLVTAYDGWIGVIAVAAVLLVIFIVGMVLTR
jgi:hypothetical protein